MPILPLVDLMILLSSGSLLVACVLKAIAITTHYRPTPWGMSPADFVLMALLFLAFGLALAARTWVKLNGPKLAALRRREHGLGEDYADLEMEEQADSVSLPHEVARADRG